MKNIILALALMCGCGANAPAIKQAEIACLKADYDSLKVKLATGMVSASGEALALTDEEITCAIAALDAKVPVAAGSN